jgi:Xaa-Pro aminopeptidase
MSEFTAQFFSGNRERLIEALPGHLLVFSAHSLVQSAADMAFPLRQDSSFYYLTGLNEPDLVLTIDTDSGESTIYLPEQNDYQKEWDGSFDQKELQSTSGISEIRVKADLNPLLKKAYKEQRKIGYLPPLPERVEPYGFYANPARRLLENTIIEATGINAKELVDVRRAVSRLRQIKQQVEIDAIQTAIDVTGKTLQQVRDKLDSYSTEKDVERALSAGFLLNGGDGHSFHPIVANGKHAATIHYEKNNAKLEDGLLLMDVGTSVNGYASDISRTWAIGKPTPRQQEIWAACLEIQEKGFAMLRPGIMMHEYQKQLEAEADKVFRRLGCSMAGQPFPHGFSHFLGLDPHDAGIYDEPLIEGSVVTVEPGIYLQDEGIGVRVEDDVLITKNGIEILSKSIPKVL